MSPIEVFTERGMIRTVLLRWNEQYKGYDKLSHPSWTLAGVAEQLAALDLETASRSEVDAIIGNPSWTDIKCDNCGAHDLAAAVQVGQELDYESATAVLCMDCAQAAVRMLDYAAAEDGLDFSRDLAEKVLAGEKTVTRRPVKRDKHDLLLPCRYRPGHDYAVQTSRGGRELGRILIQSAFREILSFPLRREEARFEGFASPAAFEERWRELYGASYPRDVWRIVFRLQDAA